MREYDDASIAVLVHDLAEYLLDPGNLGASVWLDDRAIGGADRAAILLRLSDMGFEDLE